MSSPLIDPDSILISPKTNVSKINPTGMFFLGDITYPNDPENAENEFLIRYEGLAKNESGYKHIESLATYYRDLKNRVDLPLELRILNFEEINDRLEAILARLRSDINYRESMEKLATRHEMAHRDLEIRFGFAKMTEDYIQTPKSKHARLTKFANDDNVNSIVDKLRKLFRLRRIYTEEDAIVGGLRNAPEISNSIQRDFLLIGALNALGELIARIEEVDLIINSSEHFLAYYSILTRDSNILFDDIQLHKPSTDLLKSFVDGLNNYMGNDELVFNVSIGDPRFCLDIDRNLIAITEEERETIASLKKIYDT